jgi:mono/diheme cytochrome c family protein
MKKLIGLLLVLIIFSGVVSGKGDPGAPLYISDVAWASGSTLLLAKAGTHEVALTEMNGKTIRHWTFNEPVTGVVVHGNLAFVTSSDAQGYVSLIDLDRSQKVATAKVAPGARCPVISMDKNSLFVAAQFGNIIYKMHPKTLKIINKVKVPREPFDMAVSPDGKYLFVNNLLPAQRADAELVAADVSVIELAEFTKLKDIKLCNGSNALRGICFSPDGSHAYVTHNLGRFQLPTSQLEQGWMNTAGFSIIDVRKLDFLATVILDEPEEGAAGSWDIHCTNDHLVVTHSGTHDISVISHQKFIRKLLAESNKASLSYNLFFLEGIRKRYPLKGNGPRNFALSDNLACIPTYFSDHLNLFDLTTGHISEIILNPNRMESGEDKGQRIFNDATNCFQRWQSCNGCHPGDGRTDGLNWDLLNDGLGNPKNCKSLIFALATPPAMVSGIRGSAEVAVRAGFKHIQFSAIPEEEAKCVDAYLKSLKPVPSPWLINGKLSKAAKKGKRLFEQQACGDCHNGPYYTNLQSYKTGGQETVLKEWNGWDTPTLREVWRTAPYLYNGSAYLMKEVFEIYRHGLKSKLSKEEIAQLAEYVNSL